MTSTSLALAPSFGSTTPLLSSRSISRPALANPTRSLRCTMEVEPNWVRMTSSAACISSSRSSPMSAWISRCLPLGAAPLDLARGGGMAGLGQPVDDPVVPADPVEQHLPALPETISKLLSIVSEHLTGHPNWRNAAANARHTARPVARTTTWQITQNRE